MVRSKIVRFMNLLVRCTALMCCRDALVSCFLFLEYSDAQRGRCT